MGLNRNILSISVCFLLFFITSYFTIKQEKSSRYNEKGWTRIFCLILVVGQGLNRASYHVALYYKMRTLHSLQVSSTWHEMRNER